MRHDLEKALRILDGMPMRERQLICTVIANHIVYTYRLHDTQYDKPRANRTRPSRIRR